VALTLLTLVSCGGDPELSDLAARGRDLVSDKGCAGCHGASGAGGVGPAWKGLAGSTVTLEDGSEVVADTEYLRRSIVDPQAEIVSGYSVTMPAAVLTEDEVDALVAYIEALG